MYSQYYRMDSWDSDRPTNKLSPEEFKAWIAMASKVRQEYKHGLISGVDIVKRVLESAE